MIITMIKNDLKIILNNWKLLSLIIILPVILILVFSNSLKDYINNIEFIKPFEIGIVNNDSDRMESKMLIDQLRNLDVLKDIKYLDESEIQSAINKDNLASVLVIPKGFIESVLSGDNYNIEVIVNKSKPVESYIVENISKSAAAVLVSSQSAISTIENFNKEAGFSSEFIDEDMNSSMFLILSKALGREGIFKEETFAAGYKVDAAIYFLATLLIMFLMFVGMPGVKLLIDEKENGIITRLFALQIKSWKIILSKMISIFIVSVIQFILIIIFFCIVIDSVLDINLFNMLIVFVSLMFAVAGWSVFVSAISNNSRTADIIGNLGILLMSILGGSIYPLSNLPEVFNFLSIFTINKWAVEACLYVFSGKDFGQFGFDIIVLILIGIIFTSFSVKVFGGIYKNAYK